MDKKPTAKTPPNKIKPLKPLRPLKRNAAPAVASGTRWIDSFALYLANECHLSENTVAAYRRDLRRFFVWLGQRQAEKMKIGDLAEYPPWLQTEKLAAASISRHVASLKMFYRYMQLEGVLIDNPAELLGAQKLWERVPHVLSATQVEQLLASPRKCDPYWRRNRAMLELMYATGCRVSEISGLRLADMHLKEGYCICHGKGDKQRMVPLGRRAVEAMHLYLEEERPLLAAKRSPTSSYVLLSPRGQRLRRERIWELFKSFVRRIGAAPEMSPHTMRHSFATHMLAGGADLRQVQELLGHASIATTQIYTHVDHSRLKSVHQQFHPRS